MAKREAKIIIKAQDEAKGVLDKHKGSLDELNMSTIKLAAGAAAAAAAVIGITKAVADTVQQMASLGDEMDKASQRTGVAVENLDRWAYVVRLGGGSAQDFEAGARRMQRALYDADRGVKESADAFANMGIKIRDADGNLRSADDVMFDVSDALSKMTSDTERAALAQVLLGRGGVKLVPALKQGSAAIREQMQELEGLGGAMSKDFTDKSAAMIDAELRLATAWRNVKAAFAEPFIGEATGEVNSLAGTMGELAAVVSENAEEFAQLASSIMSATTALAEFIAEGIKMQSREQSDWMSSILEGGAQAFPGAAGFFRGYQSERIAKGALNRRANDAPLLSDVGGGYADDPIMRAISGRSSAGPSAGRWSSQSAAAILDRPGLTTAPEDALFDAPLFDDEFLKEMEDFEEHLASMQEQAEMAALASAEAFGQFFGTLVSGSASAEDAIKRLIGQLLRMQLMSVGGPLGAFGGGLLSAIGLAQGGTLAASQGLTVPRWGMDSVPVMMAPGETVVDRELTYELKRMVSAVLNAPSDVPAIRGSGMAAARIEQNFAFPNTQADLYKIGNNTARALNRGTL